MKYAEICNVHIHLLVSGKVPRLGEKKDGPLIEPANGSCDVKPSIKGIHGIQSGEELLLLEVGVKSTLGVVHISKLNFGYLCLDDGPQAPQEV